MQCYLILVFCLLTTASAFLLGNNPAHASCHATCITMKVLLAFTLLGLLSLVISYPIHASCKATWDFGVSCDSVMTKLLNQIKAWNGASGCQSGGEKCLYVLKSNTANAITATHETPVHHYIDDLQFNFAPKGTGCELKGYSRSETWYAYLDFGTNYCNMKNLLTGSGLDMVTGYKETTDDSICTQHSSANCTVY